MMGAVRLCGRLQFDLGGLGLESAAKEDRSRREMQPSSCLSVERSVAEVVTEPQSRGQGRAAERKPDVGGEII